MAARAAAAGAALQRGLATGLGAQVVARQVREASDMTLQRARLIARTEMMRAYRGATHLRYEQHSDILSGWVWHAGLGPRCCAACCAMHGTLHGLEERLDDHPAGRCVAVPVVRGHEQAVQPGPEWLAGQEEALQRRILGSRAALLAYQEGAIRLPDLVGRRRSEAWGTMRYQRSLTGVLGPEAAVEWRRRAAGA